MCTHWGARLAWVKQTYGCVPCLPEHMRQEAFDALPQSVRHMIGYNNIHPLEVIPPLPIVRRPELDKSKDPRDYNRVAEREFRRGRIAAFVWRQEAHEARRMLICEALGMHPQTLALDLVALVKAKVLCVARKEGVAKVYRCIKPV